MQFVAYLLMAILVFAGSQAERDEELAREREAAAHTSSNDGDNIQQYDDYLPCIEYDNIPQRNKFENDFSNRIKQLLYNFPHDAVTTEGAKFWSPSKRAPDPVVFDTNDTLHMKYVISAANLRAFVYGLKWSTDSMEIEKYIGTCVVVPFNIDKNKKIAASDEEEKEMKQGGNDNECEDYDAQIKNLIQSLPDHKELIAMKLVEIEFEKDDETNFHMDFIECAANLRARNYRIAEKTKHEIKKIAGKMIPAIATTTALVTGLIVIN